MQQQLFIDNFNQLNMFRAIIRPKHVELIEIINKLLLLHRIPPHPGPQPAARSVHYTICCKHSLVLLRMGEIIAGNVLS
jgi:hypothetical protein